MNAYGEGATVNIRGNGNVATTLNGEQMLSAGSITTVTPDFADIPSTMVSGIEVLKSAQAKNIVAGLGGTINLKTTRPFMLDQGVTALAKAEITHGSLGKQTDPLISGFVGYNQDNKVAASLNLSYSDSYLADYDTGVTGDAWAFNAAESSNFVQNNLDVNGDGDTNDVYYSHQGLKAANRFIDRKRTGVNGSLQYQINDAFEFTGDIFYTKLNEHQYGASFTANQAFQTQTGWFTPDENGTTEYGNYISHQVTDTSGNTEREYEHIPGSYYIVNSAEYQARNTKTHTNTLAIDKEALNTNIELHYDNGGDFTGNLRWAHGHAINNGATSVVDSYANSGAQAGAKYVGVGGVPISDVNPWGYKGQDATLPDGTPVPGSYTQIPFHISTDQSGQHWDLPTMTVTENGGTTTEKFGSNVDRYSLTSTNVTGDETSADLDIFRFDGSYKLDFGPLTSVDFGARYGDRSVKKRGWIGAVAKTNQYGDAFLSRWKDSASQAPVTGESFIKPISFTQLEQSYPGTITQISNFQGATGLGSLYFVDPKAMDDPLAWHEKIYGTNIQVPDAANVYDLDEETDSVYLQANLEGKLFGIPYTGNVGFRYIKTDFDIVQSEAINGNTATFNGQDYIISGALGVLKPDGKKVVTNTGYSDFLPAFNMAFDITNDQILRLSVTKTVSTHNTDMLAGGLTVNRILACNVKTPNGTDVFCATGGSQKGNPLLEPNRNSNAEMSYEWYFSDSGLLNLGVFWIQQNTGFRTTLVQRDDITDTDGKVRGYNLTTGKNTGTVPISTTTTVKEASYTRGVEVGYQQAFDFLPGFWSGFGMSANYTYSPSSGGSDTGYYGEQLPSSGSSKDQANLAIWYEKYGWQIRIADNFRSDRHTYTQTLGNYRFAGFMAPTNYVDASINYEFNDHVKVNLQATNLTQEETETYFQWRENTSQHHYNERRLTLGMQVDF